MKAPALSIIMSTYNNASYLPEAIESVLRQTVTHWELIIINDASTDETAQVIRTYARGDKRIRYYENSANKGVIVNLNRGIALATGAYIARIDGDDVWVDRNKLHKQLDFLHTHPGYGLLGTWAITINATGTQLSTLKYPIQDNDIRNYMLIENCFVHSSVVFRKKIIEQVGAYDRKYPCAEDYGLWLKLGTVSKFHNLPECMVSYRKNDVGITKKHYRQQLHSTLTITSDYRSFYPHYLRGYMLWNLRMITPQWLREGVSRNIRQALFFQA